MYVEGEVPYCGNGNNNGFGNGWEGLIGLALVAGLFDGGFGGFGFGGARGGQCGCNCATQADLAAGFNNSAVLSNQNDIKLQLANGFAGVDNAVCTLGYNMAQGFHGVDNAICTLGYQNQQGFNTIGHQISDCCCATQRAIDSVNYNNARNTCDIIQAINAGNQRLIDMYTSDKIDTLNRKLSVAEGQISQYAQTNAIVSALKQPCPIPSYIVPNPNCCYNTCGCSGTNFGGFSVQ